MWNMVVSSWLISDGAQAMWAVTFAFIMTMPTTFPWLLASTSIGFCLSPCPLITETNFAPYSTENGMYFGVGQPCTVSNKPFLPAVSALHLAQLARFISPAEMNPQGRGPGSVLLRQT